MAKVTTFTAEIQREGQAATQRPNCALIEGQYLVMVQSQGRGKMTENGAMNSYGEGETWEEWERYEDVLVPLLDRNLLQADGLFDVAHSKKNLTFQEATRLGWQKYILRIGTHNGVTVTNLTEKREQEFLYKKTVYFSGHNCWETGITWYQLVGGRYPADIFNAMRPWLIYHNEQIEEEGEWKGWAVDHHLKMPEVVEALKQVGWACSYQ